MKRLALLVACVLFVLFVLIRELVCSSGLDLRTGKDGPGNRPVIGQDEISELILMTWKRQKLGRS